MNDLKCVINRVIIIIIIIIRIAQKIERAYDTCILFSRTLYLVALKYYVIKYTLYFANQRQHITDMKTILNADG